MNLSRPDRRERLESIAAEHALGTLPPRARARLDRIARQDPVVAGALREWPLRLAALASGLRPVTPPPRVWNGIQRRLGITEGPEGSSSWLRRIGFWRGFAIASFLAALVLGVLRFAEVAPGGAPLVVVLAGADARPVMVASAQRRERFLTLKTVGPATPGPGRTFELWALPEGQNPRSLGVLPEAAIIRIPLSAPADQALAQVPALAVSVEPPGGSPTGAPTGPVVYTGRVERMY
ncbi:MAG TPA: anti-sigma factor [Casimicrobiaceae bacterium]|nr:anti-sigma factor [Casimicrobiaceae bacterium]